MGAKLLNEAVVANKILNSTWGLQDKLKLIQMFVVMIRITILDNTDDFQKYKFFLKVSVHWNCFIPDNAENVKILEEDSKWMDEGMDGWMD